GLILRRPALGFLIGTVLGAIMPIGRYLRSPLTYLLLGLTLFAALNPAFFGLITLIFIAPILFAANVFSPGRTQDAGWDIFDLLGDTGTNKAMMGLLAGFVNASDGSRSKQYQLVKRFIRQTAVGPSKEALWEEFTRQVERTPDTDSLAETLQENTNPDQQKFFLQILVSLGQTDGTLTESETSYIRTITEHFDLSDSEIEAIIDTARQDQRRRNRRRRGRRNGSNRRSQTRSPASGPSIQEAYRILDVEPFADKEDVKKAYQQKVKQHHPDQFNDHDDSNRVEEAEEKMAEINEAYEMIKERW
ncbi:MAG: DnaJ domain-containing protein, partial [bacterium]